MLDLLSRWLWINPHLKEQPNDGNFTCKITKSTDRGRNVWTYHNGWVYGLYREIQKHSSIHDQLRFYGMRQRVLWNGKITNNLLYVGNVGTYKGVWIYWCIVIIWLIPSLVECIIRAVFHMTCIWKRKYIPRTREMLRVVYDINDECKWEMRYIYKYI